MCCIVNNKKKILVPLDGTERSMHSIDWLKNFFKEDEVDITLMNVIEIVLGNDKIELDQRYYSEKASKEILDKAEDKLHGYKIAKYHTFGYAADKILKKAELDKFDIIVMTKSTKRGLDRMIGSVTNKVVRNAGTLVAIIPE
ncbi:universal stress protein [Clostridium tyrobutyricum]|nr:universal stress protein [Clostridium tyrobutyricum]MBR9649383.1 universal stress protein [Clostridium tyrobutyricum]MBV4414655.1 universal stress protein [Clostridium tyrobutyricum]MBV4422598.1 universal stress protein [Clostridium tyrobutyricum]MBV4426078.1 universal stress protein [Clostridium tyrobutyricum]MBV4428528.1 universal stress protein [Clostridium tyrobutyricum]